tara:strand:- start:182 stop:634 length:453 start_codon:yes stop_codon:yes gene_type:complete
MTTKSNKSLSKMNKTELYEFSKELVKENMRLQLFVNSTDELHKHNENTKLDMSKKIKELEKDNEELKELGYRMDEKINNLQNVDDKLNETHRLVGEDLLEDIINLQKENEELKEKDKKAKEIFKLMGEWYEDNIIGHLPESEEEDEEENE